MNLPKPTTILALLLVASFVGTMISVPHIVEFANAQGNNQADRACPEGFTFDRGQCIRDPCPEGFNFANGQCEKTETAQATCPDGSPATGQTCTVETKVPAICPVGFPQGPDATGQCQGTQTARATCPSATPGGPPTPATGPTCTVPACPQFPPSIPTGTGRCALLGQFYTVGPTQPCNPGDIRVGFTVCQRTIPAGCPTGTTCTVPAQCPSGFPQPPDATGQCQRTQTAQATCPDGSPATGQTCTIETTVPATCPVGFPQGPDQSGQCQRTITVPALCQPNTPTGQCQTRPGVGNQA